MQKYIPLMITVLTLGISGCSVLTAPTEGRIKNVNSAHLDHVPVRTAPGVVEYVWEEPMIDVIEVPPGLDPDGVYYRPAHQEVVEIRQGRWKYYRADEK